ncbi:hypothetical protein BJ742DRAFT_883314 [Cladochytrium replicatum]|nr:hypothetical protein BJ742DRAFT_883314 [Cladochytrium replicatum]
MISASRNLPSVPAKSSDRKPKPKANPLEKNKKVTGTFKKLPLAPTDPFDESVYALIPNKQRSKPSIYAQSPKKAVALAAEKPGRANRVVRGTVRSPTKGTATKDSSSRPEKKSVSKPLKKAGSFGDHTAYEDDFETEEDHTESRVGHSGTKIDTAFHPINLPAGSRIPTIRTAAASTSSPEQGSASSNNLEAAYDDTKFDEASPVFAFRTTTASQPTGVSGPATADSDLGGSRRGNTVATPSATRTNRGSPIKMVDEVERKAVLSGLKDGWERLTAEYNRLSITSDTPSKRNRKSMLETQLRAIEDEIKKLRGSL